MEKSRFRTDQIIGIVKEHEAGMKVGTRRTAASTAPTTRYSCDSTTEN